MTCTYFEIDYMKDGESVGSQGCIDNPDFLRSLLEEAIANQAELIITPCTNEHC